MVERFKNLLGLDKIIQNDKIVKEGEKSRMTTNKKTTLAGCFFLFALKLGCGG